MSLFGQYVAPRPRIPFGTVYRVPPNVPQYGEVLFDAKDNVLKVFTGNSFELLSFSDALQQKQYTDAELDRMRNIEPFLEYVKTGVTFDYADLIKGILGSRTNPYGKPWVIPNTSCRFLLFS